MATLTVWKFDTPEGAERALLQKRFQDPREVGPGDR